MPYGATARLALAHISTLPCGTKTREIDIGRSAAEFLHMLELPACRPSLRMLRNRYMPCGCMSFAAPRSGRTFSSCQYSNLKRGTRLPLLPRTLEQRLVGGLLVLSEPFYAELLEHGVPLDSQALLRAEGLIWR